MGNVRPITWTGFVFGVFALFLIPFSPPLAVAFGAVGVVISTVALMTSPDE